MNSENNNTTVLVTGATGFIAQHCVLQLLEAGYTVKGTARSVSRADKVAKTLMPHLGDMADQALSRVSIVAADLTSDDGWDDAVAGCKYVLHVASPFPRTPPKHENDLIEPARDGALRVLRAAEQAGVARVVLTSSVAAIISGHDRTRTFDESEWSDINSKTIGAYEKSKTITERAAWDFMKTVHSNMELAVINPGLVLGPVLNDDWSTSGEVLKKIFDRDFPAIPNMNFAAVDVRDVASAHISAMTKPGAAGKRFICAIESRSMRDVADILDREFSSQGFKIPTKHLPDFAVRIVALWDKTARLGLNALGGKTSIDNSLIKDVLDWQPRSFETMVVDMGQSFIDYGIVKAK